MSYCRSDATWGSEFSRWTFNQQLCCQLYDSFNFKPTGQWLAEIQRAFGFKIDPSTVEAHESFASFAMAASDRQEQSVFHEDTSETLRTLRVFCETCVLS